MVFTAVGAVVLLIVIVLGIGFYQEYVAKPALPVATVNGVGIPTNTYQKVVRYRRYNLRKYLASLQKELANLPTDDASSEFLRQYIQNSMQRIQSQLLVVPNSVLDELIEDEIIRQEAAKREITVTPDEIQTMLEEQFGYYRNLPTATPTPITATLPITITPTPTTAPMTQEQFEKRYQATLKDIEEQTGFTERDLRSMIEAEVLREKLAEAMGKEIPTTGEQVRARHILLKDEETALATLARLNDGEDFAKVAEDVSEDAVTKEKGGELGWFPEDGGSLVPTEVAAAAFAVQGTGVITGPVKSFRGYHIIEVEERDPNHPFDEYTLRIRQQQAFDEWLQAQVNSEGVDKSYWSMDKVPPDTDLEKYRP